MPHDSDYDAAGYRETSTATELRRKDGLTVQVQGHGPEVRALLASVAQDVRRGRGE